MAAFRNAEIALRHASDAPTNDLEAVLAAVQNAGIALRYASDAPTNDLEMVLSAVQNDKRAIESVGEELRFDREVRAAAGLLCCRGVMSAARETLSTICAWETGITAPLMRCAWAASGTRGRHLATVFFGRSRTIRDGVLQSRTVVLSGTRSDVYIPILLRDREFKQVDESGSHMTIG